MKKSYVLAAILLSHLALAQVAVDPSVLHQRWVGFEAHAWGEQEAPDFPLFKDRMYDLTVDEIGIDRVRLEVRSGCENDRDYWTEWQQGLIDYATWRGARYANVNDNADPNVIAGSGFHFSELDNAVDQVVAPLRQRLAARGRKLYVNLCYVAFTDQIAPGRVYLHDDPREYGEFILATFLHLQSRYGWTPDGLEMILEPDNVAQWNGTLIGRAIVDAGDRLAASGFHPDVIAPSTTSMSNAVGYFDALWAVPGAARYVREIAYHRYAGVSPQALQSIASRAASNGLGASMLEWWFGNATYEVLHEDLTLGRNTAWQQFAVRDHFDIDRGNPSNPTVQLNAATRFTRQYMRYIRAGARRIGATSTAPAMAPVGFVNTDATHVVVVNAAQGGTVGVAGLPAGTYGVSYTVSPTAWGIELGDRAIQPGEALTASIPGEGAITFYGRDAPWLLRNDETISLDPPTPRPRAIFTGSGNTTLELLGADGVPLRGEGPSPWQAGSDDDDDAWRDGMRSGDIEPEVQVCIDASRPLVFYQVNIPGAVLRLTREPPCIIRFRL